MAPAWPCPAGSFEQSLHHCRAGTADINSSICAPTHVLVEQHEEEQQHGAGRSHMAKWVTWTGNSSGFAEHLLQMFYLK